MFAVSCGQNSDAWGRKTNSIGRLICIVEIDEFNLNLGVSGREVKQCASTLLIGIFDSEGLLCVFTEVGV
jgi:hypothetical protein